MFRQMTMLCIAVALLGGCKARTVESGGAPEAAEAAAAQPSESPVLNVGLSVDHAYAAIPHRRTVWDDRATTVPGGEKAYLKVIFEVMDEGVAVRVTGQQHFSVGQFDSSDPAAQYGQLIDFVRAMPIPKALADYHQKILTALSGQQQFFADWRAQRGQFGFAQQVAGLPGVQRASAALRTAYDELMAKYPNESSTNKDAFFDYHRALDFL